MRFISDLCYFDGNNPDGSPRKIGSYPAILAPVRNRVSGELTAVLRIWLKPDGSGKALINDPVSSRELTPKKVIGTPACGGIWFGRTGETLIMCEGPEDALSLIQATGMPVVAASTWHQMGKAALPSIVKRLIVVPDDNRDPDDPNKINVGERGLEQAAHAYHPLGIQILVARLPDWRDSNDVLRADGAEALALLIEDAQPYSRLTCPWRSFLATNVGITPSWRNALIAVRFGQ
jgi:hypothetical protein